MGNAAQMGKSVDSMKKPKLCFLEVILTVPEK